MSTPFEDVPDGEFYSEAVDWAYNAGITTGTSPTTFEPYRPVTRAEVVTFLHRYELYDERVDPDPDPVIVHEPDPSTPDVPVAVTLTAADVGGDPFPSSPTGGYGRHITTPTRIEHATIDWRGRQGKALLVSANLELHRCHIIGGEDGVHHNGGDLIMTECIVEGLDYPSGSHSDAYQASSGGAGGTAIIEDCMLICGYRQQNAPIQLNVIRRLEARRNYLWGGVYGILGDQGLPVGPLTLEDNMFAWGTQKYGTSVFGGTGVWWDPRVRPRLESPWAFNEAEAMVGFPGNGTAI